MTTIAFMLYPRVLMSSITLPAEMMNAAEHFYRVSHRGQSRVTLNVATLDGEPVTQLGLMAMQPNCGMADLEGVDLLYLPALWRNPRSVLQQCHDFIPLLQRIAASPTLICAVGSGSCILAEAGLLDHKPGTTHWYFMETFSARYPEVDLKRRHLITQAGNLYCAGSINSVADLTGHFIERFYGPRIARQVEAHFSPEIRRSYRQYSYLEGEANLHDDEEMIDAQQWLHEHFARRLDLAALARQLKMSQRTLNRRFKRVTGMSPSRYVQQVRLEHARELLRDSNLPISEIAVQVGYPDMGYFATLFREQMAQSPTDYRKSVRGKLFSVQD